MTCARVTRNKRRTRSEQNSFEWVFCPTPMRLCPSTIENNQIERRWPGASSNSTLKWAKSKSVYFGTLAEVVASMAKAEREGNLAQRVSVWLTC